MNNRPQIIILCEDIAQESFIKQYLIESFNIPRRDIQTLDVFLNGNQKPQNNADIFKHYPKLIHSYRAKRNSRSLAVIVMTDADNKTLAQVKKRLHTALNQTSGSLNRDTREPNDRVAIFIPARNIETWFYFIENFTRSLGELESELYDESIDRKGRVYGNSSTKEQINLAKKVAESLVRDICSCPDEQRPKLPSSLQDACLEFKRLCL